MKSLHFIIIVIATAINAMLGLSEGAVGQLVRNFPGLAGSAIGLIVAAATVRVLGRGRHSGS